MKILVIGDPHFKKNNLHLMTDAVNDILTIIDKRKPDLVVCLGDTLDTHERIDLRARCKAVEFLEEISKRCECVNLIGNHDRENNSDYLSEYHPFTGCDIKNLTIVSKPMWIYNYVFVPYVPCGKFMEALKMVYDPETHSEHPDYIFAHQEFKGCVYGKIKSTKGDTWNTEYPEIISGHIHEYQVLKNITYVGTFMQTNYGETEDKAILELPSRERIRLPNVKKFITIRVNDVNDLPEESNDNVRVILELKEEEIKTIKATKEFKKLQTKFSKVEVRKTHSREKIKIKTFDEIVEDLLSECELALDIYRTL